MAGNKTPPEPKSYRDLKYGADGLLPVVVQDIRTGTVLMVAYMNREALRRTLESGKAWFWSRSRREYWLKGETSGNILEVRAALYDCDADTVLLKVVPCGPGVACHTGRYSCFFNPLAGPERSAQEEESPGGEAAGPAGVLIELAEVIRRRRIEASADSYTARLLAGGREAAARKVGEEALETVLAALGGSREKLAGEAADLLYHLLVLLEAADLPLEAVLAELARRRREK